MKKRILFHIGLLASVCLFVSWTTPSFARLFPPCQAIDYSLIYPYTISYGYTDPTTGIYMSESWSVVQADERQIISVQVDQGILTWIDQYKASGEPYYHYSLKDF